MEKLSHVKTLLHIMRNEIRDVGLDKYLCLHDEISLVEDSWLDEAITWLEGIVENEAQQLRDILKCQPKEQWDWYDRSGLYEETVEYRLREKARVALRKVIRSKKRPKLFKKSRVESHIRRMKNVQAKDNKNQDS